MACPFNVSVDLKAENGTVDCAKKLMLAHDLLEMFNGKWKMEVILYLLEHKKRRFKELQNDVKGISSRILSSVLKDLEDNHVLTRTVIDTAPITVEYELTEYGRSMKEVIVNFIKLGQEHRNELMGK